MKKYIIGLLIIGSLLFAGTIEAKSNISSIGVAQVVKLLNKLSVDKDKITRIVNILKEPVTIVVPVEKKTIKKVNVYCSSGALLTCSPAEA